MTTMTHDTYVRARIDTDTKERATNALAAMGFSVSDAIRMLLVQVADENRLPFEVKIPNRETLAAMAELEAGRGHHAKTVKEFMAAMNARD